MPSKCLKSVLAACLLAVPLVLLPIAPSRAAEAVRELSTDRPDLTESPFSVPKAWLQLEMDGLVWAADDAGGVETRTLVLAPVNLKLGLSHRSDLQVVYEPWVRTRATFTPTVPTAPRQTLETTGSGALTVRLKWNLLGNDAGGVGIGLLPWLAWDTGGPRDRWVSASGIAVPVSVGLAERIGMGAMVEVSEADREWALLGTATLAFDVAASLGAFGEIAAERIAPDGESTFWSNTLNAGVTLGVGPDFQLDGGLRVGVSEAADDVAVFLGLAARRPLR